MSTTIKHKNDTMDDYMNLIHRLPLRPIRTQRDYKCAGEILTELVSRADNPGLSPGETDYLDMLVLMIGEYDRRHSSLLRERRKLTPLEALKALMQETGMNGAALGRLLGSSGQASLILNGKRELSKANIRKLADHFKVSPALFI